MEELTIGQLQEKMESGALSARSVTQDYLQRIAQVDQAGPTLRSIIEVNPDALAIAEALDVERAAGRVRGPLHGVPVVLKDNIDTGDRMQTTAGSLALQGNVAAQDGFVAAQLRKAGAVILAKANMSEWANFRSTRSSSGWSSRGGQVKNPYALDRNPCGSSSGSGVAVAANLCVGAIGTETDGSIVCPSNANGIVGIKPTVGLVSRTGIIPISHRQDTAGPMARTVRDAAILLGAMTGVDPQDEVTQSSQGLAYADYTQFLDPDGLRGLRVGVARTFFGFHESVDALMEEAIHLLRKLGAEVVDPVEITTRQALREPEWLALQVEFKAGLNHYLANLPADFPVRSLADVIAFNQAHHEQIMPYFGQELHLMAQEQGPLSSQSYLDAVDACLRLSRTEGIDATLDTDQLDLVVAPTGGPAWVTDPVNGDRFLGASSSPAAVAGYPNITVPLGYIHGLPVGVSFFGRAFTEPTLLKAAYAFEQAQPVRRQPQYRTTIND